MPIYLQGIQLSSTSSGPVSLSLNQLNDVSINAPVSGDYLRYNSVASLWQNSTIDADVFDYLSTSLIGTGGVTITPVSGPNTVTIGVNLSGTDIETSLGFIPVNRAGDTMTGDLVLNADPTLALGAATKHYVDTVAAGLTVHPSCQTGTDSNLSAVYNNGSSGAGATLTGTGALPLISSYSAVVGDRILVKNQTNDAENGIYTVTAVSPNWLMTRAEDFDGSPTSDITAGDLVFIQEGDLGGTQWVQVTPGVIVVGTSPIVFQQFAGPGTYSGGTGIDITGTLISNTGVLSVAGTSQQIAVSASSGNVIFSLPSNISGLNTVTATAFIGNASSASTLQTSRTFSVSGDATGTSAGFNGSVNATIPLTLATVNSSPVTDGFRKITVNAKGLVTATSPVTSGDITSLISGTYVLKAGDTMTGSLLVTVSQDSQQGLSVTNSSIGASAQSRAVFNNDQSDSLSVGVNSSGFTGLGFGSARDSFIRSGLTSTGLYINATNGLLRLATNSVDRLQINSSGAWGLAGANYGTSGQVLSSNGSSSAPTWTDVSAIISGSYVAKAGDTMTGALINTSTIKVGNGAASNTARLMVNTTSGTAAGIQLFQDSNESWIIQNPATSTALTFSNSGTDRMTLSGTGNLGIARTPSYRLDVSGDIRTIIGTGGSLLLSDSNNTVAVRSVPSGGDSNLGFYTQATGANNLRMILDAAGSLGIGTGSPLSKLHVRGTGTQAVRISSDTSGDAQILLLAEGVNGGSVDYERATSLLRWQNGTSPRMVMDTAGNVGINNTAPQTRLHANGNIRASTSGATLQNHDPSGTTSVMNAWVNFLDSTTTERGWIGFGTSNNVFTVNNSIGATVLRSGSGEEARFTGLSTLLGTTGGWSGSSARLNIHYTGVGSQYGISLNTPDTSATESRALNFIAGGDAAGGGTPTVRGYIGQSSTGMQLRATNNATITSDSGSVILATNGANRLTIANSGNGAATFSGEVTLSRQDSVSEGGQLNFNRSSDNTGAWAIDVIGASATPSMRFINISAGSTVALTIDGANNVGIGTATPASKLDVAGTVTATAFNATSTAEVKDRIEDLSPAYLDKFDQLRPREYDRTDYQAHEFGFIAEEMEKIYPEIVGKDSDGKPTGIDYGKLSTILTAKVLEQQNEIDTLKEQVRRILGELSAR